MLYSASFLLVLVLYLLVFIPYFETVYVPNRVFSVVFGTINKIGCSWFVTIGCRNIRSWYFTFISQTFCGFFPDIRAVNIFNGFSIPLCRLCLWNLSPTTHLR